MRQISILHATDPEECGWSRLYVRIMIACSIRNFLLDYTIETILQIPFFQEQFMFDQPQRMEVYSRRNKSNILIFTFSSGILLKIGNITIVFTFPKRLKHSSHLRLWTSIARKLLNGLILFL